MRVEKVIGKCACGCDGDIIYQSHHKYYGIPKYIPGHSSRVNPYWKGKKLSKDHVEKLRESHKDVKLSEEHKRKLSESRSGTKHHFFGKHLSVEHRIKMSQAKGMTEYIVDDLERSRAKSRRANLIRRNTPEGRLRNSISESIRKSLKDGKEGKALKALLPYSMGQLKNHLEKQFKDGMTWSNYGQWHVDHRIPISAFNFETTNDLDFQRCWDLKNLQPMWAMDNFKKGGNLDKPFQPCLRLTICG